LGRAPNTSVARDQILILTRILINRRREEKEANGFRSNKYTIKTLLVSVKQEERKDAKKEKEKKATVNDWKMQAEIQRPP